MHARGLVGPGVLFVLLAAPARPQSAYLSGRVTDTAGGVVPGVRVQLINVRTGAIRTARTNLEGEYFIPLLHAGKYEINLRTEGFLPVTRSGIVLETGARLRLDFVLSISPVQTSIQVELPAAGLQLSSAEIGSVISEREVLDLPLNGRNFTPLTLLTPGASPINTAQNRTGAGTTQVGQVAVPAINGQTGRSNLYLIDGVLNMSSQHSTPAVAPVIDAIQEFKIRSHNDLAEFGSANGGIINVVTKTGTNEFHGAAWWFLRNDNLDARNFFRPTVTPLNQNQFGGTLGGPIIHNKTFFFGAYQGFRRRTPADRFYRVPTAANLQGDMSDWPKQIFDPYSGRPDPNNPSKVIRDPFPNNLIPADRLDAGFLDYAAKTLPAPISVGVADFNQHDVTPTKRNQDEWSVRVDHNQGDKDMFWGRVNIQDAGTIGSGGRQTLVAERSFRSYVAAGSWVHTFSSASVLELRYSMVLPRFIRRSRFRTLPRGYPGQIGYSEEYYRFRSGEELMPQIRVADFFAGGEEFARYTYGKAHSFPVTYSHLVGRHSIKIGGQFNSIAYDRFTNDHFSLWVSSGTADPQNKATTGSPLASWLLDVPTRAGRRDFFKTLNGMAIFGFFVQDSWKVTPKLTINIGLRYDYTKSPVVGKFEDRVIYTGTYDFKQSFGGVYVLQEVPGSCEAEGGAPCIPGGTLPDGVVRSPNGKIINSWTDNWQPRFGIAYRLTRRTALRGSFGMFFDNWAGIIQLSQNIGHTWPDVGQRQISNLNAPTPGQPAPDVSSRDPFFSGIFPEPTPYNTAAWFVDPNIKNSYSMQWNFGIQQEVAANSVLSVNYVGSGNRRNPSGVYYNTAQVPGPGNPKDRRPFPWIRPTFWEQGEGRSSYHALQVQFKGRNLGGLSYMLNYTWSKTINLGCDGFFGVEGCHIQDPYNWSSSRSVAGMDLPHIFTGAFVWELPFGRDKLSAGNAVVDYIIGGWQLNGILTLHSGRPFTVNMNGDIANTGNRNGYMRPNIVGDPHLENPTVQRWFNTEAFAAPPAYTYGNAGRNILRADGRTNVDLSVFKDFPLPWREGLKLQFRAEAFNAFNHADFAPPTANLSSSRFGKVTRALQERQLQLGLKLIF